MFESILLVITAVCMFGLVLFTAVVGIAAINAIIPLPNKAVDK